MGNNSTTKYNNESLDSYVSGKTKVATKDEVISSLKIAEMTGYIEADSFVANPYSFFGRVIQMREKNGVCLETLLPSNYKFGFTLNPIPTS
jgi:hypothetical protein